MILLLSQQLLMVCPVSADYQDDLWSYIVYEFCMNYSIEGFRKSYANYMKKQESEVSDDLLRALGYSEEDIAKNY